MNLRKTADLIADLRAQLAASEKARQEAEYFRKTHVCNVPNTQTVYWKERAEAAESLLAERDNQLSVYREALEDIWHMRSAVPVNAKAQLDEACDRAREALSTEPFKVQAVDPSTHRREEIWELLNIPEASPSYDEFTPKDEGNKVQAVVEAVGNIVCPVDGLNIGGREDDDKCITAACDEDMQTLCQAYRALKGDKG